MRAHIAYINYTKQIRIFNILNYFCVVYILHCVESRWHFPIPTGWAAEAAQNGVHNLLQILKTCSEIVLPRLLGLRGHNLQYVGDVVPPHVSHSHCIDSRHTLQLLCRFHHLLVDTRSLIGEDHYHIGDILPVPSCWLEYLRSGKLHC